MPDDQKRKLPGTLTISNGGKIELETIGLFYDGFEALDDTTYPDRILGYTEDGKPLTLEKYFYVNRNISFGGISKSKIYASRAFIGAIFEKNSEIEFNTISFSLDLIDEWIGITGIEITNNITTKSASINYRLPTPISISIDSDISLDICFSYSPPYPQKINEARIHQNTFFKLKSIKTKPLKELSDIAYKIINFICLATTSIVSMSKLTGITESMLINSRPANVDIFYESIPFTESIPPFNLDKMLFRFKDIEKNPGAYINAWLDAYEDIRPSFDLYFATQFGAHKYIDGKFLSLSQALETLHRNTSNEKAMSDSEFKNTVSILLEACPIEKKEWLKNKLFLQMKLRFRKD